MSAAPTPTLTTERFVLRELTRADAPALFPSFSDPEVMRWWSRGPFVSEEELADWLVPESGWDEGRRAYWLVAPRPQWRQKKVKALVGHLTGG